MKFKEYYRIIQEKSKIENTLRKEFPEVRFVMTDNNYIILKIFVIQEKRRGKGEARKFMDRLVELASKENKKIYLSTTELYGGDEKKLIKFYKSLGFVKNSDTVKEDLVKNP